MKNKLSKVDLQIIKLHKLKLNTEQIADVVQRGENYVERIIEFYQYSEINGLEIKQGHFKK